MAACHPGEGRDPPYCKPWLSRLPSVRGAGRINGIVETWISAFAGMTSRSGLLGFGGLPQADFADQRLDRAAGEAETGFVDEAAVADPGLGGGDQDLARQGD